jgi:ribosomal protein S18 acetylase RimI-like enzyme
LLDRKLMEFAEQRAKENLLDTIRLDCFALNKRANLFYQKFRYEKKCETSFRKGLFNLYEKQLYDIEYHASQHRLVFDLA